MLIKNINTASIGGNSSNPTELTIINETLFFQANDGVNGRELWKSDGTASGTVLVRDIRTFVGFSSTPTNLTNVNGTLFFQANDGSNGYELWKSDGTASGTTLVKNISPSQSSLPSDLTNVSGTLFFLASDGTNGEELWKSNGTSAGTVMVKDIRAGSSGAQSTHLMNFNGSLFFAANDGINGNELWRSTGIASQTALVKNINAGAASSGPRHFTNVNGVLYFVASDAAFGYELWKSDGTPAGTLLVSDLNPGINSSSPSNLTNLEGTLVASADSGVLQRELWKMGPVSTELMSANGFGFDIDSAGQLIEGTRGAFDGLNRLLINGVAYASPNQLMTLDDNNRTVLTSIAAYAGLNVSRELTVPVAGTQDFVRTVDVFHNPTGNPISISAQIVGNVGSNQNTSTFLTSDGDTLVELTDNWFGTDDADDTGTPAIVHLLRTPFGRQPTSVSVLGDNVTWSFDLTVPAGETVRLAGFTILADTRAAAISAANSLINNNGFAGQAAAFLTASELNSIVNFQFNQAPTDLWLSNNQVIENTAQNALIGTFSTIDPNTNNSFQYSLVVGDGSADNLRFTLDLAGNLRTASAFNYEAKSSYSIRVRTTDQDGLWFEKAVSIMVIDLPELVAEPVFGDGTSQRSLVTQIAITFDSSVNLQTGAFLLQKRGGGAVTHQITQAVNGLGQSIVTLTFSGALTRGSGALLDGYYQLLMDGTKILRGAQALDLNADGVGGDARTFGAVEADAYFALFGDTNGDGLVGIAELGQFRNTFGKTSSTAGYSAMFDYDLDSAVGVADFGQFRSRFGKPKLAF